MKTLGILLCFVLLFSCKSGHEISNSDLTNLSPETAELVALLIETDYIGTEFVFRTPEPSVAYANREALLTLASENELITLTEHPEGEVAATAFEGLVRNEYADLKTEFLRLSAGDRKLNFIQGDVVYPMPALEYAYVNVLGNSLEGAATTSAFVPIGLTEAEKAFVENRIKAIRQTFPD